MQTLNLFSLAAFPECKTSPLRILNPQLILLDSFQLDADLGHPDGGCEKRSGGERNVQLNQRHFFNFHIRWNQLAEYGYAHGHEDVVKVRFVVSPLQVDLKQVMNITRSNFDGESDGSSDEDAPSECYYYSSSSFD